VHTNHICTMSWTARKLIDLECVGPKGESYQYCKDLRVRSRKIRVGTLQAGLQANMISISTLKRIGSRSVGGK
jgi:hypothetical protein